MSILHADSVGETILAANGGTGTLTLSGTAIVAQDCRTFAASVTAGGSGNLTDGGTTEINIREVAADGAYTGVWENTRTIFTVSGNTVTRGTLLSSSTGSRINFSTSLIKHVFVGISGEFSNSLKDTSGTNTGNETLQSVGTLINTGTEKATPVSADMFGLMDSAAGNLLKKLSWTNLVAALKTALQTTLRTSSVSTGTIKGGTLSITGAGVTVFSIADGNGLITDNTVDPPTITAVTWTGKTGITATHLAAALVSYVSIDSGGNVVQQTTAFTNEQCRTHILLGSLIHVNLSTLDAVNNFTEVIISPANQLADLGRALGRFNISGNIFSANGANLNINKSVGKVYSNGSNWATNPKDPNTLSLASLTALSFQYRFSTGTNGVTGIAINPDIYDLNGVSTAVGGNKHTVQRIYSFVSNNVKIQPGQTVYNSLAEAKASIQTQTFVTEPSIAANGILRGFLVIKQGTTSLQDAAHVFFYEAGKFSQQVGIGGQSVSTMQNAYDNSNDPEILTDATRGAVSIKRGSAADTNNVLEVLNGAGTITYSITGAGVVAGSNLSGTNTGDQTNISGNAATVTTNANLTGPVTSSGNATAIANKAIALAKLADGTAGNIVTYDASGVIAVAATGTVGQVLTSGGAGVAPTMQTPASSAVNNALTMNHSWDFLALVVGGQNAEIWTPNIAGTGSFATAAGTAARPGMTSFVKSTSAVSRAYLLTDAAAISISGGETTNFYFTSPSVFTGEACKWGFQDTNTTNSNVVPIDGLFFRFDGSGALVATNISNSVSTGSVSGTIATLAASTQYRTRITVNSNATSVLYELFDNTGASLGTATLTGNIPTGVGRETGHGITAGQSGASTTATTVIIVDYMDLTKTVARL